MNWTKTPPKEPGFYWRIQPWIGHEGSSCVPIVIEVFKDSQGELVYEEGEFDGVRLITIMESENVRWSDAPIEPPNCDTCNLDC